jgi:hypothetical protein
MTPRPMPFIIDSGIKVLLLTTVAYESAFIYEATYLAHFGIPIALVDVTLHVLLLYGIACLFAIIFIIWLDIFWSTMSAKMPPRLRQSLMVFFLLLIAALVLCALLNAPLVLAASFIHFFVVAAAALLIVPLILHRRLPNIVSRYWAIFGGDSANQAGSPSILWFSVSRSIIIAVATLTVAGVFSLGIGICHARFKPISRFTISPTTFGVLRLSSDGYLCVGIDFQKRVALGTFRFLDPKSLELHIVRVGQVASFAPSLQRPAVRAATP